MAPLYDKRGELCHVRDTGQELVINSLKNMYKSERELLSLLNFIATLEKMGFFGGDKD